MNLPRLLSATQPISSRTWLVTLAPPADWPPGHGPVPLLVSASQRPRRRLFRKA